MGSRYLAASIGLIIISAGIVVPVEGQSADLKSVVGAVVNKALEREVRRSTTTVNPQTTTTTREQTRQDQAALNKNGYAAGPVDGIPGKQTFAAIRAFQRDNGWPATGTLTDAQRARLFGLQDPGAAAVATGLLPLLLDDGSGPATGTASALQERKTTTVINGVDDETTDDLTLRRKSRAVTGDSGTAPIGGTGDAETTATVTEGQNLNTTAGDSQQSLKSLLTTSTQPSGDESTTTTERNRAASRTATSVDSATETLTRQRRTATGDAASVGAGRRAGTGNTVADGDCAAALRRAGGCAPTQ